MKRMFIVSISLIPVLLNAMGEGGVAPGSCRSIHEGVIAHLCERAKSGYLDVSSVTDAVSIVMGNKELPDQAKDECRVWCQRFSSDRRLQQWLASYSEDKNVYGFGDAPVSIVNLYHLRQKYIAEEKSVPANVEEMYREMMCAIWSSVCIRISDEMLAMRDDDSDDISSCEEPLPLLGDSKNNTKAKISIRSIRDSLRRSSSGYHPISTKSRCFPRREKKLKKVRKRFSMKRFRTRRKRSLQEVEQL